MLRFNMAGRVALLPISVIDANPDQPRRTFEPFALNELADSIKTLGIIQPLTVRRVSAAKYQLISGERRFRASQLAGLDQSPRLRAGSQRPGNAGNGVG